MPNKEMITRKKIIERLNQLLEGKISANEFGKEVFDYLTFVGDKYQYEKGYEDILEETLKEFMDLHDVGKRGLAYSPYVPSKEEILRLEKRLE